MVSKMFTLVLALSLPSTAQAFSFKVKRFEVQVVSSDGVAQTDFNVRSSRWVQISEWKRTPDGLPYLGDTTINKGDVFSKTASISGRPATAVFEEAKYSQSGGKNPSVDVTVQGLQYCSEYSLDFYGAFDGEKQNDCFAGYNSETEIEKIPQTLVCRLTATDAQIASRRAHAKRVCEKRPADLQFLEAIYDGNLEAFRAALTAGATVNAIELREWRGDEHSQDRRSASTRSSALLIAYAKDQWERTSARAPMIETILNHRDYLPNVGGALLYAASFGDTEFAEKLLDKGENPNQRGWRNATPLREAVHYASPGAPAFVRLLLARGADKSLVNLDGVTPLQWAQQLLEGPSRTEVQKAILRELIEILK